MLEITTVHYLVLSFLLFATGLVGILIRRKPETNPADETGQGEIEL